MFENLSPLVNILLLSLIASMGTGLGGLIAIIRKPGRRSYGFLMGFTAGVMISLSFLELVNKAWDLAGPLTATIGFGIGAIFMFVLDHFAPHIRFGEKEIPGQDDHADSAIEIPQIGMGRHRHGRMGSATYPVNRSLMKTGLLLAVGITLHNLPEGIAVGAGYLTNPQFGIFIAFAILLHNIPEGLATALPLTKAGMHRGHALLVAFLSGLAEPVGALIAALFLVNFSQLVPGALAFAGGVMTFITLDELIPTAREYGHEHYTAIGIILGALSVFTLSGIFGV
jgi:ZIP family zinc transporter